MKQKNRGAFHLREKRPLCGSFNYLLAKFFDVVFDARLDDILGFLLALHIVDHGVFVLQLLVYREEVAHLFKNVLRQL